MASTLRRRKERVMSDNVAREDARAKLLRCGHTTKLHPLATLGSRRLYVCPEGCPELQEVKS